MQSPSGFKSSHTPFPLSHPQTDLELASSSLSKSDADLAHARASNKRLMAWRVSELPRTEALRVQLAEAHRGGGRDRRGGNGTDAGRQRPSPRGGSVYSPRGAAGLSLTAAAAAAAAGGRRPLQDDAALGGEGGYAGVEEEDGSEDGTVPVLEHNGGAGGGAAGAAAAVVRQTQELQRSELRAQVESLRRQLAEERAAKDELFERYVAGSGGGGGGSGGSRAAATACEPASTVVIAGGAGAAGARALTAAAAAGMSSSSVFVESPSRKAASAASSSAAAMQLEVLGRRHAELKRSSEQVAEERDALRRALTAVRMAVPELAAALGITAAVAAGGSSSDGAGFAATPHSRASGGAKSQGQPQHHHPHQSASSAALAAAAAAKVPAGLEVVLGSRLLPAAAVKAVHAVHTGAGGAAVANTAVHVAGDSAVTAAGSLADNAGL